MIVQSAMLAEVLSDCKLQELLLGELRRRAKILRKAGGAAPSKLSKSQHIFPSDLLSNPDYKLQKADKLIVVNLKLMSTFAPAY